jgi:hypothetical protein
MGLADLVSAAGGHARFGVSLRTLAQASLADTEIRVAKTKGNLMPHFVAHVELQFEAENLAAGGARLRELQAAASTVGFKLKDGRVEPEPEPPPETGHEGWIKYTP